jgi:hypothetical protein
MRKSRQKSPILWRKQPAEHNYPAAESYLTLLYRPGKAARLVAELRKARVVEFKAKDIFRASRLSLLGISNSHVENDRRKIRMRCEISPILLVRDDEHGWVIIADGYHRLCAVYRVDEDAMIPCKIV